MPKRIVPLTDLQLKTAKPKVKEYKLSDGGGLHLLITPSGGKLWRCNYRFDGKQKTLFLKSYPEITLSEARKARDDARQLLANGVDPGAVIKAQKIQVQLHAEIVLNTFEKVAKEWLLKNSPQWSDSHIKTITGRLDRDVFPVFGDRAVTSITRNDVKCLMEKVAARGTIETADRIKLYCRQILRYALNNDMIESNPIDDMKDILAKRVPGHHAALTDPRKVSQLLRAIDGFDGSFVVKCALQLAPLLFVRPGELRAAEWSEIDLDNAEWNIPAIKMKMKSDHLVPLSQQAIAILKELVPLAERPKLVYEKYSGLSFIEYQDKLAEEIVQNEPPEIFESFDTDRSYCYGTGLNIVVHVDEINRATIEESIRRFRQVGESNWRSAAPLLRSELPMEAAHAAFSRIRLQPSD